MPICPTVSVGLCRDLLCTFCLSEIDFSICLRNTLRTPFKNYVSPCCGSATMVILTGKAIRG